MRTVVGARLLAVGALLLAFGWEGAVRPADAAPARGFVQPLTSGSLVVGPAATLTSSAAGATGVTYLIDFTTSPTGALTKNVDTITISTPSGTTLSGSADLFDLNTEQEIGFSGPPTLVGGTQATWTVANSVPAGDTLEIRTSRVTNPPAGSYQLNVSTSADTTPVATPSYTVTAPQAVDAPTVTLTSIAAGASGVTYLADFTTSPTGGLATDNGSITVAAPSGTAIPGGGADLFDVTTGEDLGLSGVVLSNGGATATWSTGSAVPAGHLVELTIPGVKNASGAGGHLTISTSSDSVAAPTPDFALSPAQPVLTPTLAISSQAAAATGVIYTVDFRTSATGGLAGGTGTITLAAPTGTSIPAAGIAIRDVTTGEDLSAGGATLSNGGATATWPVTNAIPAGHHIRLIIPGVTNPAAGTPYQLSVSTSSDTAAQTPAYQIGPSATPLSVGPTALISSLAAGVSGVGYTVIFTTGGGLTGGSGTITLQAPAGTVFPSASIDVVDLTTDQDLGGTSAQSLSNGGATSTWTVRNSVPGQHEIELRVPDVTNPGAGSGAIAVSTSSDTTPADTPSYTMAAPTAVSAPLVLPSSAAAGIPGVAYTVFFTTNSTGGLDGGTGTFTLKVPGAQFTSQDGVSLFDITTDRVLGGTFGAALSDGNDTATWRIGVSIPSGHRIRFGVAGVINPPMGNVSAQITTSSDTTAAAAPSISFVAPTAVSAPALLVSSTTPSATNVTYTVSFTTGPNGALACCEQGTVTVQAPSGTVIPSDGIQVYDVSTDRGLGGTHGATLSNSGATATWPLGGAIAAGQRIRLIIHGVTNPASSADSITVSTSSDAAATNASGNPHMLSVSLSGDGTGQVTGQGIACPGTCSATYAPTTEVTLTAKAAPGSIFTGWLGDCSGTGGCSVVLSADRNVTATFVKLYTLTVSLAGNEAGSVSDGSGAISCPGTCSATYPENTEITLTATPASPDSALAGWTGGGCSGTGTCVITLNADIAVTATFNTTLIVTTQADYPSAPTPGSLRDVIMRSNAYPGPHVIEFAIGTAPGVTVPILPQAPLPAITVPVTIDGTTQPGYAGTPLIQLDGSFTFFDAGQQTGLDIAAGSTTVRGLDIRYWRDQGVILEGKGNDALAGDVIDHNLATTGPVIGTPCGICITSPNNTIGGTDAGARNLIFANANAIDISGSGAGGNVVEGNYIGTTSGPGNISNGDGILIDGSPGNTIGGTAPGARNVISGNDYDGVHINGAGASGNTVEGNYIGVDPTGTTQVHNGKYGVEVTQAPNNTIGGTAVGAGNVISGNEFGNVFIVGTSATGNLLAGNYIGTDATGEQALRPEVNVYSGGGVFLAAPDTTIGGTSPAARNVISGNGGDGVAISREEIISFTGPTTVTIYTADHELVEGNYIGVDARGTARLGNGGYGVTMGNTNNTVGGTTAGARNVISGNGHAGVLISGGLGGLGGNEATYATDDAVQGNYIGTDATGAASIGNTGAGVLIEVGKYATNNTVSGNVISGNGGAGVDLQANSNAVQGNDIGTDASGHKALPNQTGVKVEDENNTIGGTAAGTGNVISGNTGDGVDIYFASDPNGPASTDTTLVQGNYIGTDASGVSALGNSGSGVLVSGQNVTSTTIGGTGSGARNIISGNKLQGIEIDGQGGDTVQGNDIGTDATGATLLANGGGIDVTAPDNTIGGTAHGAGNLIDGTGAGIGLAGKGNTVQGNTIGTNAAGTAKLSRFYYGVQVTASSNAIGGTVPGAGNVITGGYGGVLVTGAAAGGNPILGNSIFGNVITPSPGHTISGGGIALTQGGNGSELPPVLAPLRNSTTTTTISGLVKPGTHRIEVFRNDSCTDPEGKTLVGVVITTKTTWSLTVGKLAGGQGVTATSTNTAASNTSPFSACKVTPRT